MTGSEALKQTPLHQWHQENGGKIVPFAGWEMPVQYSGIIEEHKTVRTAAGLFDITHMGEVYIEGPEAGAFINNLVTKDINSPPNNTLTYALFLYENGTAVDDLMVYKFNPEKYLLIVNAANTAKDLDWINKNYNGQNLKITDTTDKTALFALQGPKSQEIIMGATRENLDEMKFLHFTETYLCDYEVMLSRSGYTGEDGFEIACDMEAAGELWEMLMLLGEPYGIKPIGLGARDSLRLEACYSLYGHEIDDRHTPLESKLNWAINWDKEFIGKPALLKQKEAGLTRRLVGFEMQEKGIPRQGYPIMIDDEQIGEVVSGTYAPSLDKFIGLGFVKIEHAKKDMNLQIQIRNKAVAAKTVKTPFYKAQVKR